MPPPHSHVPLLHQAPPRSVHVWTMRSGGLDLNPQVGKIDLGCGTLVLVLYRVSFWTMCNVHGCWVAHSITLWDWFTIYGLRLRTSYQSDYWPNLILFPVFLAITRSSLARENEQNTETQKTNLSSVPKKDQITEDFTILTFLIKKYFCVKKR